MMKELSSIALFYLFIYQSHAFTHHSVGKQFQLLTAHSSIDSHGHVSKLASYENDNQRPWSSYPSMSKMRSKHHHSESSTLLHADISAKITDSNEIVPLPVDNSTHNDNGALTEEELLKIQKRKIKKRKNRIMVSIATTSMFSAFLGLIYMSGPGQWRYYLAGGICAAVSHAITTPVDVIKVCFLFCKFISFSSLQNGVC